MEEKHDREEILDYIEIRGRTWSRSSIGRRDRTWRIYLYATALSSYIRRVAKNKNRKTFTPYQ